MNLDPTLITEEFKVKDCIFGGDPCIWIAPSLQGVAWNNRNLILRSSIWRKSDYKLISAGFKKFFNWEEKPDIFPPPRNLIGKVGCVEKIDGSCLIVSKYNGELIIRTRNALASGHLNGEEVKILKSKYPKAFDHPLINDESHSFIYEWVTPSNKIVLHYLEVDILLTNVVYHGNYSYWSQLKLDELAKELEVKRPKVFSYSSIDEMLKAVESWEGLEGLCVYYGDQQHIRKVKSTWYLNIHKFKSDLTIDNLMALYIDQGYPGYKEFVSYITNTYDFECAAICASLISKLVDAFTEVKKIVLGMHSFLAGCNNLPSRKEKAQKILAAYGDTNRSSMLFHLLDGHEDLTNEQYKKLIYQCLT